VVQETRVLLFIAGGLICLLGLIGLCAGGFGAAMMANFLGNPSFVAELDPTTAKTEEERLAAEAFLQVWTKAQPLLRPAVVTVGVSTLLWSGVSFWMGVATIQGRRWARKILLAAGWAWCGNVILQFVAFLGAIPALVSFTQAMPAARYGAGGPPGLAPGIALQVVVNLISYGISAAPGIVLIIVFGLRNVRLSCEHLDPNPNWTDRVPIQVLPIWLTFVSFILQLLLLTPFIPAVAQLVPMIPWSPGVLVATNLGVIAFLVLCTWLVGRMHPAGWWLVLIGSAVGLVLGCAFHLRTDFAEVIRSGLSLLPIPEDKRPEFERGIPPDMIKAIATFLKGYWVAFAATGAVFIGYLFWIKRFFDPQTTEDDRLTH
jgi:hypothetical protein